jgi:hypothetical protein
MHRIALAALMSLVSGCKDKPAVSEAVIQQIRAENPGVSEKCLEKVRSGGVLAYPLDESECFEMLPAQRWKGLWNTGWEWTSFCPAPASECPITEEQGDIWLEYPEGAYTGPELTDGIYEVEFVGRRTKSPGRFGHMGQYDHLMIADHFMSVRKLPNKH